MYGRPVPCRKVRADVASAPIVRDAALGVPEQVCRFGKKKGM